MKRNRLGLRRNQIGLRRNRLGLRRNQIVLRRNRLGLRRNRLGLRRNLLRLRHHGRTRPVLCDHINPQTEPCNPVRIDGTIFEPINLALAQVTHGDVGALGIRSAATGVDAIAGGQGVEEFQRYPLRLKSATRFREWLAPHNR